MNAKMIGSTLVSFVGGVSEADRQSIQDCLLFAELYANEGGRSGAWTWLSNYQSALLKLGFKLTAYIDDQPLLISNAHQVRDYKVQIAGVGGSERMANLLGGLFDALYVERDAFNYLDKPPAEARVTNYQSAPCESTDAGLLVLVCGLQLSSTPHERNPDLSFVRLNSKGGAFQFDAAAYAARRNEVQTIIRGTASTMIKDIEL